MTEPQPHVLYEKRDGIAAAGKSGGWRPLRSTQGFASPSGTGGVEGL